ncbi:hypothetical protein ACH5BF_01725 [Arcobacter sp. YIC-464]|uniref:hypothetical protein n=1 Tax=Arcobacter sp. YIC-464 TaxID=3376631 RepID=UPI003C1C1104
MGSKLTHLFFYFVGFIILKIITLGKYPSLSGFLQDEVDDPGMIFSDSAVISGFGVIVSFVGFGFFLYYTSP